MKAVFADANYWIALLNPRDELHAGARTVSSSLEETPLVTSQMVLTEVLNGLSKLGPDLRAAALKLVRTLQEHRDTNIIPQTPDQFEEAVTFYGSREDKPWGLTDCSSFQIMRKMRIRDALTYDRDFEQAGFRALLRDLQR